MAKPIVRLLYEWGAWTAESTELTAGAPQGDENLPQGYAQTFAEEIGQNKTIVYEMADNSLVLEQTDSSAVLSIDSEETDFENMTIMGGDGRYYNNDDENVTTVIFLQGDSTLTVYTSGKERMQGETLVRFINQNLIYTN